MTSSDKSPHQEITVCDCHVWPTVQEMHDYVVALEARIRVLEDKQVDTYAMKKNIQCLEVECNRLSKELKKHEKKGTDKHPQDSHTRVLTDERLTEIMQELECDLWPSAREMRMMGTEIRRRRTQ